MEWAGIGLCYPVIILCLMSSGIPALRAQTTVTGAIQGQVRAAGSPPSKGGIVGADVSFYNEKTKVTRTIQTTGGGYYVISDLPPGRYKITASSIGYREYRDQSSLDHFLVRLSDNNSVTPPPLLLQPDGAMQTMPSQRLSPALPAAELGSGPLLPQLLSEFAGLVPTASEAESDGTGVPQTSSTAQSRLGSKYEQLVNTVNATRSGNFDEDYLLALPLFGTRSFDDLAFLLPGVAPPPQTLSQTVGPGIGAGVGTSGQFAVNGLRSRANIFTVDGSDNNDEEIGVRRQGFTALLPQSVESLQEFYIATLLPTPQFGRNLGAQVNAVSRPGEPDYHGTVYAFFTDRRLKAREFFDMEGGPEKYLITKSDGNGPVLLDGQPLMVPNPVCGEDEFTRGQFGFVLGGPVARSNKPNQA